MARGPAEFWVLAPATPTTHLSADYCALSGAFPVDSTLLPTAADVRDEGIAVAKSNLDAELRRLREIGATVDGAVGDPNPMVAIEDCRAAAVRRDHPFDPAAGVTLARHGSATPCPAQNKPPLAVIPHEGGRAGRPGPPDASTSATSRSRRHGGEVLIKVAAFGLNRSELHTRLGLAVGVTFPRVLGIEAVGTVAACPSGEFPLVDR